MERISPGICVPQVGAQISLGIRVSRVRGTHVASDMGQWVSRVGERISLGIRVSRVGESALFPFLHFRKNRPGKCVSQYSRKKK